MEALRSLGGPDWFNLGDGDLALHVLRSAALARGERLSAIIDGFARAWGVETRVLPMSDDAVSTFLSTDAGELAFQDYFVALRCAPVVSAIRFEGAAEAVAAPGVVDAILGADSVIIAPSNPFLSVDPILAVPGVLSALAETKAPVVAVSPIVGGQAVKGPTAKLMRELGVEITPRAIAQHYAGVIDGLLIDERDAPGAPGVAFAVADTLMKTLEDRARVAEAALALARRLV
jgi:LPPG:FO 2-phospho-L-lactate transferase